MYTRHDLNVRKNSGELAPFDPDKLARSLCAAGVDEDSTGIILDAVAAQIYEGISTREIYRMAFSLLKKIARGAGARYRLKEAIMQLGPTGYPFERFLGDIFSEKGYTVKNGVMQKGYSITHELDVLAYDQHKVLAVECKYHMNQAAKSDVKVPMYILSRFTDVKREWKVSPEFYDKEMEQWVATNTRFTEDAVKFAEDYGLKILSWDYPRGESLKEWITDLWIFPVTCLSSLGKMERHLLIEKDVVSCKCLYENMSILRELQFPAQKISNIRRELESLFATELTAVHG